MCAATAERARACWHKLKREGGGAQVLQRDDGYFECTVSTPQHSRLCFLIPPSHTRV